MKHLNSVSIKPAAAQAYNQNGEAVYTFTPTAILARRPDPVTA
jgi:hypothetical protein